MKDVKDLSAQEQEYQAQSPVLPQDEQEPLIGVERATEISTAGASAVVQPQPSRNAGDMVFGSIVRVAVWIFLAVLVGIVGVLVFQSWPNIQHSGFDFFTQSEWDPVALKFGAAPLIFGTILVAGASMLVAGIVGILAAIYLVEYAPRWIREPVAFLIELLAYIPSVVYGLWGLLVMAPWLQQNIQPWLSEHLGFIPLFQGAPYGVGIMAAIMILSIMLLPLIVSLSREALLLVPDSQREAMLALGATRWEVLRHAVLPYARGAIFGAIILSLGRALGETMAVAMTIGGGHNFPKTLFDQGYTLSSVIANEFAEVSSNMYLSALIEAGLTLFVLTAAVNLIAYFILQRLNRTRLA